MTTPTMDGSSPSRPRILFLDAYDSFSNNITALLATLLGADVHVLPIDAPLDRDAFCSELACYDAIVCGPGPGSPNCPADIGLMKHVWAANGSNSTHTPITPALGICLGFQSLVLAHGGRIRRLRSGGLHGMVRPVEVKKDAADIFAGVAAPFRATLYHSLGADVGQDDIADVDWPTARWMLSTPNGDLVPLAWVDEKEDASLGGTSNERLLMGVRHRSLPFWGLQYHPESVCTDAASHTVLVNWFRAALTWNVEHGRVRAEPSTTLSSRGGGLAAHQATRPSLLSLHPSVLGDVARYTMNGQGANGTNGHGNGMTMLDALRHQTPSRVVSQTIPLPSHVEVPDIVETLRASQVEGSEPEQIILDSASAASETNQNHTEEAVDDDDTANDEAIRGRFSIIALDFGAAMRVEYRTGDRFASIRLPHASPEAVKIPLQETQTIWQLLAEVHETRRLPQEEVAAATHRRASPFLGGFMGYISYEQGLGDIGVPLPGAGADGGGRGHNRPDVCFAWVTKSIVVDHVLGVVHVQHLEEGATHANGTNVNGVSGANGAPCTEGKSHTNGPDGKAQTSWVDGVVAQLQTSQQWQSPAGTSAITASHMLPRVIHTQLPDVQAYEDKVRACQEHIAAGDSYELCLTDETRITTASPAASASSSSSAWNYYRLLRKKNPAPFASYLRLGGATLVSSSPERFLCFSPRTDDDGKTGSRPSTLCSMRPMKGTVRRSAAVATLAQAEALLHIPKEEAENLMIVDLVRHDLHGVCGPGHVTVPRLLQVEPYGHVFQMVTVVEGALAAQRGYTGLDVLAASLPPGSMTGAPKKRSCALLRALEERPSSPRRGTGSAAPGERSLYSGVVGYLCVTGRGDWSVTIRSLFRWDDETTFVDSSRDNGSRAEKTRRDVWHIGAGGAVTILSTPEGERDEMFVKLSRPLSIFE